MRTSITLSEGERLLLKELMELLCLNQKEVARLAEIQQSWLSRMLRADRDNLDTEMVISVVGILVKRLDDRKPDESFSEARVHNVKAALARFIPNWSQTISVTAGDIVPSNSPQFMIRGSAHKIVTAMETTQPILALVRGPIQCGKSSLLKYVETVALEKGIDTVLFDAKLPFSEIARLKEPEDYAISAVQALYKQLQVEWNIAPHSMEIDSIQRFNNWLMGELSPTRHFPRLLILDDLGSLGLAAAEILITTVIRCLRNLRAENWNIGMVVGLRWQYGQDYSQVSRNISSVAPWSPMIDLEPFDIEQIELLCASLNKRPMASAMFRLFAGQPYLTHAALSDASFMDQVEQCADDDYLKSLLYSSRYYRTHLRFLFEVFYGPSREPNSASDKLVERFYEVCRNPVEKLTEDQREFLANSHLLSFDSTTAHTVSLYSEWIANNLYENLSQRKIRES